MRSLRTWAILAKVEGREVADERYDAAVIGSGQGGTPLATALAEKGQQTLLIEAREVGGTCINYGCTPTKTMVASARMAYETGRVHRYGIESPVAKVRVDMVRVRDRKRSIVESFRSGSERRIAGAAGLTLARGTASFLAPKQLSILPAEGSERIVSADRIFIDTGTRTALPAIRGLSEVPYLNNETIMELDRVPESLLIIGGGYIGVEFAQMFRRFGASVTLIQRGTRLLNREDGDVSDGIAGLLRSEGVTVLFGCEPVSVASSKERGREIRLDIESKEGRRVLEGTHLLLASGRMPNTDRLNLEAAGIAVDERGYIRTNERLETSTPGIWALGDVKGGPAFTHISYDDYRIVMRNLFGDGRGTTAGRLVPYTVFTDPQLGRVGIGEEEAHAAGLDVKVAKMPMSWVARALEVDETFGFMKAVVEVGSGRILGFAALGMEGGEIAGAVQLAMMGGLPASVLKDAVFAHPTIMESLNNLFASL